MTDAINCHGDISQVGIFKFGQSQWRDPESIVREDGYEGIPYRTCDYCGCIHPDDLIKVLADGAELETSDWKYGWPHKFYVEKIKNARFDANVKVVASAGSTTTNGKRVERKEYGPMRTTWHAKWYNTHLTDLDDEKFKVITDLLFKHAGVLFKRDEKGLKYNVLTKS